MLKRLAYVLSVLIDVLSVLIVGVCCLILLFLLAPFVLITPLISIIGYIIYGELNRTGFIDCWTMVAIAPVVLPFEFYARLMIKIENKLFNNEK